jgi:hypothetical protein
MFVWKPAPKGICTVKDAFSFLNADLKIQLPTQGTRSVTPQAMQIMQRVWKHKTCSPIIKTFAWRVIRRAIATCKRVGTYCNNFSQVCPYCPALENDAHLFFMCNLPRAVWFTTSPSIITSSLPQEDDGVQNILTTLITPQTTDDQLIKTLYVMWYLWKARNDKCYNNKDWNARQVLYTANADFEITHNILHENRQH